MAAKISVPKEAALWKDRRRRLGLPLSFTRYEVFEDRLLLRRGLLNTTTDEVLIYRVMDIRLRRTLWQKIFGVGSVTLVSTDKTHPSIELKNIRQSDQVRQFLSQQVESQRAKRGISSREFLGGIHDGDPDIEGDGHL